MILHKVAGKCQQLRLVVSKATFVPNTAAWPRSAEVSLRIAWGRCYLLDLLLHLSVPMILEVPVENAIYTEGKL
jgi:hypothetical protein